MIKSYCKSTKEHRKIEQKEKVSRKEANMGCALPQTPLELRDCVGGSGVYFGKNNYFNRHLGLQKINYPFREFSLENKTAQT